MKQILLLFRSSENGLDSPSWALFAKARSLGSDIAISAALFGPPPAVFPGDIQQVFVFSPPSGAWEGTFGPDAQAHWLADLVPLLKPDIVLAPANLWGKSLMPVLAALTHAGLTADCTDLWLDGEGALHQVRPACGGKLLAEILSHPQSPAMATVHLNSGVSVPSQPVSPSGMPEPRHFTPVHDVPCAQYIHRFPSPRTEPRLERSPIVVAGGRGIGSAGGFQTLERLASLLQGTVAASRGAVNCGYAPYACQVGQSGHTIAPDVYFAIGISGAVQHLSGILHAKKIIAVNTDPHAPIFQYADIGIVTPWQPFVEALIHNLEEDTYYET